MTFQASSVATAGVQPDVVQGNRMFEIETAIAQKVHEHISRIYDGINKAIEAGKHTFRYEILFPLGIPAWEIPQHKEVLIRIEHSLNILRFNVHFVNDGLLPSERTSETFLISWLW